MMCVFTSAFRLLCIFLEEMWFKSFVHFLSGLFSFYYWLVAVLLIFCNELLIRIMSWGYFSQSIGCFVTFLMVSFEAQTFLFWLNSIFQLVFFYHLCFCCHTSSSYYFIIPIFLGKKDLRSFNILDSTEHIKLAWCCKVLRLPDCLKLISLMCIPLVNIK